jgi:hypothetical protein
MTPQSNCLAVLVKDKIKYYPFQWTGLVNGRLTADSKVQVWNDKAWVEVEPTDLKLGRPGERVFKVVA